MATVWPFAPFASASTSVTVARPGVRATASASPPSSRASTTASGGGSAGGCPSAGTLGAVAAGTKLRQDRDDADHAEHEHDLRQHGPAQAPERREQARAVHEPEREERREQRR